MWNLRKKATKLGATALAAGGLSLLVASPAFAATAEPGAQIVNPVNQQPLTGQNSSTTPFEILLPNGNSSCTGNTASNGFLVDSYLADNSMVPNPGTIVYQGANGPTETNVFPLIEQGGSPSYEGVNTTSTGGVFLPVPTFDWTAYFGNFGSSSTSGLPIYPGTFNLGISCATSTGAADNFWNVQIQFAASTTDPNQFTWTVVPTAATPEVPYAVLLPLSAAGIAGAGILVLRRRRRPSVTAA
jgi:hypothetical protein